MSLIEQLGGYSAAKAYLERLEKIPMHEQAEDTISYLPDMILEYRRQHNIYEVGDFIFDLSDDDKKYTGQILRVDEMGVEFLVCYDNQGKRFCVIIDDAVHATDAEIKAGKRLEVKA